ncbi:hypothetical protein [Clostridium sp.]|uniref:hypothetical protein n=1 Tax=Clostridium sp. TaxID=1506 RepID=UPI0035A1C265
MINDNVLGRIWIKAQMVFLNPTSLYSYDDVVYGKYVDDKNGNIGKDKRGRKKKMCAVDSNTLRAFERKDKKSKVGPKYLLNEYLKSNKNYILNNLKKVQSQKDLKDLEICICSELKKYLLRNVLEDRFKSFNRLRKPVDLLIEHLVCMAVELDEYRNRLLEYLFIPLDSQIFNSELLTRAQLSHAGVSENSTFGDLDCDKSYYYLQSKIAKQAEEISSVHKLNFYTIYFDLLWGNRYKKWGETLFETNIYDPEYDK